MYPCCRSCRQSLLTYRLGRGAYLSASIPAQLGRIRHTVLPCDWSTINQTFISQEKISELKTEVAIAYKAML